MIVDKIVFNGKEYSAIYQGDRLLYDTKWVPECDPNAYLHINGNGGYTGSTFLFQTDYTPNYDTSVDIDIHITGGAGDVWYAIMYSGDADNSNGFWMRAPSATSLGFSNWGSGASITAAKLNPKVKLHIRMERGKSIVTAPNDNVITNTWRTDKANEVHARPLRIGCWQDKGQGKIERSVYGYYGRITFEENGVAVRDYFPVIDKEGTPCYYDKVNGTFMYIQTSGTITMEYGKWE